MSQRLWPILLASALLAGCPATTHPPPPPPVPDAGGTSAGEKPDRSGLPKAAEARDWAPPGVTTFTLGNGMAVWHLRQAATPLISLRLVFPNGSAADPRDKAGLTGLTADMLDEGAGKYDALQLGEELQRLATDYGTSPSVDATTLHMSMLADTLAPSLSLLADIVQRPHLSAAELQRRQGLWVAQAISRESNPNDARVIVMQRVMFGEGYAGLPGYGTKTSLQRISLADVKRQYQAVFQPEGATFVVVGDVSREALAAALESAFGGWKGKPSASEAPVAEPPWPKNALYRVDFPGATQSSLALVARTEGAHSDDYFPALVFNWSLGGSFASRLNLNLREDKGYTYGAHAHLWRFQKTGLYALAAQVKSETTRASIDEVLGELEAIRGARPVTAEEHRIAVDGLLLGFPGRFETLGGMASQLADLVELGRPANWLTQWPDRVRAVTLEAANASAKRHAGQAYAIVVAGDVTALQGSLADIDRPVYDCDPEGNCKPAAPVDR